MRKWNEIMAKNWLSSSSSVRPNTSKLIVLDGGVRGLKACSALDYLQNYCGYKVYSR